MNVAQRPALPALFTRDADRLVYPEGSAIFAIPTGVQRGGSIGQTLFS